MLFAVPQLKLILNFCCEMGACIRMLWLLDLSSAHVCSCQAPHEDRRCRISVPDFGEPKRCTRSAATDSWPWSLGKTHPIKIHGREKSQLQPADLPPACLALCVCVAVMLWAGLKARISVFFVLWQRVKHSSNVCFTFAGELFIQMPFSGFVAACLDVAVSSTDKCSCPGLVLWHFADVNKSYLLHWLGSLCLSVASWTFNGFKCWCSLCALGWMSPTVLSAFTSLGFCVCVLGLVVGLFNGVLIWNTISLIEKPSPFAHSARTGIRKRVQGLENPDTFMWRCWFVFNAYWVSENLIVALPKFRISFICVKTLESNACVYHFLFTDSPDLQGM